MLDTLTELDQATPDWLTAILRRNKVANPDTEQMMPRRNLREVQFYTAIAPLAEDLPVVRCYDVSYHRAEVDHFHLLLDDPSRTTHRAAPYSAVPPTPWAPMTSPT